MRLAEPRNGNILDLLPVLVRAHPERVRDGVAVVVDEHEIEESAVACVVERDPVGSGTR